jgi:hypothetical protein
MIGLGWALANRYFPMIDLFMKPTDLSMEELVAYNNVPFYKLKQ